MIPAATPCSWSPRPMKYVLERNDSGVWGNDPTGDADSLVLRSTDISLDGRWSLDSPALRSLSLQEQRSALLEVGDVVVVKSSGSPAHLGKTALVTEEVAALAPCFSNFVQRLRPKPDTSPRYLWYFLNSLAASSQVEMFGTTTTGLRNLSGSLIGSLVFPGPPTPVQHRVADVLDTETARIDALIEKKGRMIELFDERRMAVMTEGVEGRVSSSDLIPSTLPWLGFRPAHWAEVKLTLLAHLGSGHTPSRDHPEWWEDCTIPWITTGEVAQMRSDRIEFITETREMISELGVANSSAEVHPAGTVVLCRTASAGYAAIMGRDMATSQDFATWTCGPLLRSRFLLLCLRVMRQDLLGRLAMGSTHQTIYMPDIEAIRVPVPPVLEQDEIVEAVWKRLRTFDVADDLLRHQIDLLLERRQALITAAITGELDVAEAA